MDDSSIIALFFARSEQAITALAAQYGALCGSIARNILRDPRDAEECVNDAYLAVWNAVPPAHPDPLRSYLCRIVRNLAIKRYHANTAQKRNSAYDLALEELGACFPAGPSAEEAWSAREIAQMIDSFLETLDRETRVLFVRRYWYGDSVPELAALFQTTGHNVSVRLSRIRKKLKKYLIGKGVIL